MARRAPPTQLVVFGCASLALLTSCLDFDRYGEGPAAGGAATESGGAPTGGSPALGGENAGGEGSGGDGEGGAMLPPVCGDGVLANSEECDDDLGPAGACIDCVVVCEGDNETKIGKHCYFLDPEGDRTWQASQPACNSWRAGAYIAAVESPAEQSALESLFTGTIWLGGEKVGGEWSWVTGVTFDFENWDGDQEQPDNIPGEECMGVWQDSLAWHDMECSNTNQYLCEWEPPKQ